MTDTPWVLSLTLRGPSGEHYSMSIPVDAFDARNVAQVTPPGPLTSDFKGVVEIMERREFRKRLFMSEAHRLGAALAERMEDAEGWHNADRIEPARKQLGARP